MTLSFRGTGFPDSGSLDLAFFDFDIQQGTNLDTIESGIGQTLSEVLQLSEGEFNLFTEAFAFDSFIRFEPTFVLFETATLSVTIIPEPTTFALAVIAAVDLGAYALRRRFLLALTPLGAIIIGLIRGKRFRGLQPF